MTAIAQLPMYDFPEVRDATDSLWRALARRLRAAGLADVPDALARDVPYHVAWGDPHLLLGQSCGYPALRAFRRHLRIIAKPVHSAPGCAGATHRSFIVVPAGARAAAIADLRGRRFALNSRDSNTGMNLPRRLIAPVAGGSRFFSEVVETGSHAESLARVAACAADAAAIDCVSHAILARERPALVAGTRILARSAPSPALPFVTGRGTTAATIARLREALAGAMSDSDLAASRERLFLSDIVSAGDTDYAILGAYEAEARRLGYPDLA